MEVQLEIISKLIKVNSVADLFFQNHHTKNENSYSFSFYAIL